MTKFNPYNRHYLKLLYCYAVLHTKIPHYPITLSKAICPLMADILN